MQGGARVKKFENASSPAPPWFTQAPSFFRCFGTHLAVLFVITNLSCLLRLGYVLYGEYLPLSFASWTPRSRTIQGLASLDDHAEPIYKSGNPIPPPQDNIAAFPPPLVEDLWGPYRDWGLPPQTLTKTWRLACPGLVRSLGSSEDPKLDP